jgi:hypothetical protein
MGMLERELSPVTKFGGSDEEDIAFHYNRSTLMRYDTYYIASKRHCCSSSGKSSLSHT